MTDLKQWHKEVCSRDGYRCVVCKKDFSADYYFNEDGVNQYVCGHHLQTQKAHPELVLVPSNGICVCLECHNKIHKGLVSTDEFFNQTVDEAEENVVTKYTQIPEKYQEVTVQTLPNGEQISYGQKLCKCKKFIAIQATGICMSCEKRESPQMKKSPKSEKKK